MPDGPVVVNSGPLIALSLLDSLDLLLRLFSDVRVPAAVFEEVVTAGQSRPGAKHIAAATWLQREPANPAPDPLLAEELGKGEAEAIALAVRIRATWLVLDDRKARRIAEGAYRLNVIGTAGVLVRAKKTGLLSSVGPSLSSLRAAGYFLFDRLVRAALEAAGE